MQRSGAGAQVLQLLLLRGQHVARVHLPCLRPSVTPLTCRPCALTASTTRRCSADCGRSRPTHRRSALALLRSTGPTPRLTGPRLASGPNPSRPVRGDTQRTAPSSTSRCSSAAAAACTCGNSRSFSERSPHALAAAVARAPRKPSTSSRRASEWRSHARCTSQSAARRSRGG